MTLAQCDKKAYYSIDQKEFEYEKSSIAEMAAQERDFLIGEPDQGEITITYKSGDMGGHRQIGSYEARHIATTVTFDPSEDAGTKPARIDLDGWYIDLPGWDRCEDWPGTLAWGTRINIKPSATALHLALARTAVRIYRRRDFQVDRTRADYGRRCVRGNRRGLD